MLLINGLSKKYTKDIKRLKYLKLVKYIFLPYFSCSSTSSPCWDLCQCFLEFLESLPQPAWPSTQKASNLNIRNSLMWKKLKTKHTSIQIFLLPASQTHHSCNHRPEMYGLLCQAAIWCQKR